MNRNYISIRSNAFASDVVNIFEDRDLVSAPVVDKNNILLGRITIDDVVDVIREESESAVLNMAGLTDEEDIFAPILPSTRRRAIWLGINLIEIFLLHLMSKNSSPFSLKKLKLDISFGLSNKKSPLIRSSFVLNTLGVVNLLMNNVKTTKINIAIINRFFFIVIRLRL